MASSPSNSKKRPRGVVSAQSVAPHEGEGDNSLAVSIGATNGGRVNGDGHHDGDEEEDAVPALATHFISPPTSPAPSSKKGPFFFPLLNSMQVSFRAQALTIG